MQDGNADFAILVDCDILVSTFIDPTYSIVHLLFGCHMGVSNFIFGGMCGYSGGKVSFDRKKPPWGPVSDMMLSRATLPPHTAVELVVVTYHQHNLPLKDVVVVAESTTYPWDILVTLHLFQLACEKTCCCC
jgi:hypothetical protein